MPGVPVPVSQFDDAVLPLTGAELLPFVQNGHTVKGPVSAFSGTSTLGPEVVVPLVPGVNNNVAVTGSRLLINTTAGDMSISGFAAKATGTVILVTNTGVNNLTLLIANVGSLAANRLVGIVDMTFPAGGSAMLCYSGALSRWVLVS